MSTLKSLLPQAFAVSNVHPRPRKRPPRCTLDCGFKTSESPALRGFVAERCPITGTSLYLVLKSNGLPRPKIRLKKFGFSSKSVPANIAKKLPLQLRPKPLFIAFFNFSHKRPTFAFTSESGYTLGFRRKMAHSGLHAETQGFILVVAWRFISHLTFGQAKAGGSGCTPMACVRFLRRRGPAGLRDLFLLLSELRLTHHVFSAFRMCETRGGITTLGVLCVLPKLPAPAC